MFLIIIVENYYYYRFECNIAFSLCHYWHINRHLMFQKEFHKIYESIGGNVRSEYA